jgi:hypothetical protein
MLPCESFVPALVAAGRPRHHLLRIVELPLTRERQDRPVTPEVAAAYRDTGQMTPKN